MCNVSTEDYDIILLTETFLNSDILTSELGLDEYIVFRCDRSELTSTCQTQGGVLVAIKNCFSCRLLVPPTVNVEQLFIKLTIGCHKILLGNSYISGVSSVDIYEGFCFSLMHLVESDNFTDIIVWGDFNLPNVLWQKCETGSVPTGVLRNEVIAIADCITYLGLYQLINIPNIYGNFLDLMFCNHPNVDVKVCPQPLLKLDLPHPAFECCFKLNNSVIPPLCDYFYLNFKLADFDQICACLSFVDWSFLSECDDVNAVVSMFYEVLDQIVIQFTPVSRFKTPKFPKWMNHALKSLIIEKKLAHKRFKTLKTDENYVKFSNLRSQCRILSKNSYQHFVQGQLHDRKSFWRFVNSKKLDLEYPKSMCFNDVETDDPQMIAEMFKQHFSYVYSENQGPCINQNFKSDKCINLTSLSVSSVEIFNKIESLNGNLGVGPDGIPAILLRNCKCVLSDVLCKIFNLSLATGIFPTAWKRSYVTPVFKDGDKSDIKNYRAISKISVIAKVFESIIYDKLSPCVMNIIINEQHGFTKGKSTVSNLLTYEHHLLNAFENKYQVDAVYTDFSKAFDRVDHGILVNKLRSIGIHGSLLKWLESNVTNRYQVVKIKNHISSVIGVTSGVAQGGHLSSLLYNVFANDIKDVFVDCLFLGFADDLKIFKIVRNRGDCLALQDDLNRFSHWCNINRLTLNTDKCKAITFCKIKNPLIYEYSLNDTILQRTNLVRDLGVWLDSELTLVSHIEKMTSKAMRLLGFVFRSLREVNDVFIVRDVYCALVRSLLEYASSVWQPCYAVHRDSIERIQTKFLKRIGLKLGIPYEDINCHDLMNLLNLTPLENRRVVFDIYTLFKIINNKIDAPDLLALVGFHIPSRESRNKTLFHIPCHRTNYSVNSPLTRMCVRANSVMQRCNKVDFFNDSSKVFLKKVRGAV